MDIANNIHLAAHGNAGALSDLVADVLALGEADVDPVEAMIGAEVVARLSAAHGSAPERKRLAAILIVRSQHVIDEFASLDRGIALAVEAFQMLEKLWREGFCDEVISCAVAMHGSVDDGDEVKAVVFDAVVTSLTPRTVNAIRAAIRCQPTKAEAFNDCR